MTRFTARNVSLVLMLVAFPLISIGATRSRPLLWWLGFAALMLGALMPPAMRFVHLPDTKEGQPSEPTDLGDSCRVC